MPSGTAPAEFYRSPSAWNNIQFGGCCIRFDTLSESGSSVVPRIHANTAHIDVGVERVFIDWSEPAASRYLHFGCENPGAIITMGLHPDETMTGMGITTGPSGGGALTKAPIYKSGTRIPAHSLQLHHPYANLWCWWMWFGDGVSPVKQAVDELLAAQADHLSRIAALEAWQQQMSQ